MRKAAVRTVVAFALAFTVGACDDSNGTSDDPTAPTTIAAEDVGAITVGELLDRPTDGDTAVVFAYVLADGSSTRICEVLAESFPPQCGGRNVEVRNPDDLEAKFLLDITLTEEQDVRWTEQPVSLIGWIEDGQFVVT